jgi:hypothetical protein
VPGVGLCVGVGEPVGVGLFVGVGDLVGVGLLVGVGDVLGVGFFVGDGLLPVGDGSAGEEELGFVADGPEGVVWGGEAVMVVVLLLGEGELAVTERDELGLLLWTAVSTAAFGLWPHFAAGASAALAGVLTARMPKTPADSTLAPARAPRPAPRRVVNTI